MCEGKTDDLEESFYFFISDCDFSKKCFIFDFSLYQERKKPIEKTITFFSYN
jgi:hypothetical protein